jgi:hypothetical protein
MKTKLIALIAAAALCTGCAGLQGWYNKPETQAQISTLEQWAVTAATGFLQGWITSHMGASKKSVAANPASEDKFVAAMKGKAKAKFPGASDAEVEAKLRAAFRSAAQ